MNTIERPLKVTKTGAFGIDVCMWSAGDTITALTVTEESSGLVSVGATQIDGTCLKVLLTGITVGTAELHFNFATSTSQDCQVVFVEVIEDC